MLTDLVGKSSAAHGRYPGPQGQATAYRDGQAGENAAHVRYPGPQGQATAYRDGQAGENTAHGRYPGPQGQATAYRDGQAGENAARLSRPSATGGPASHASTPVGHQRPAGTAAPRPRSRPPAPQGSDRASFRRQDTMPLQTTCPGNHTHRSGNLRHAGVRPAAARGGQAPALSHSGELGSLAHLPVLWLFSPPWPRQEIVNADGYAAFRGITVSIGPLAGR
jgi:hypothetical protein